MARNRKLKNGRKSQRYSVWMKQAGYDLAAAKLSLDSGFHEWCCFQSEQALEKSLKAVLVRSGWRPPKIHKIGVLLGMCNQADPKFAKVNIDFHRLESFTFVSRYPFLIPGQDQSPHEFITAAEAQECLDLATSAHQKVEDFLTGTTAGEYQKFVVERFNKQEVEKRLELVVDALVRSFDVKQIVLFGSFAKDLEQLRDKTLDLLIVANTDLPFFERISSARELLRGDEPIIEALVYTPEEFDEMLNEVGEGFLETAIEEGREIYAGTKADQESESEQESDDK